MVIKAKWDERFLKLAHEIATWSKDPSTKVGAVIAEDKHLVSVGYNGFPRGIDDTDARLSNRPVKYSLVVHGELNSILNASRSVKGCTLYCTHLPCNECAKAIIQSGIRRVVCPSDDSLRKRNEWYEKHKITLDMFEEVGITLDLY